MCALVAGATLMLIGIAAVPAFADAPQPDDAACFTKDKEGHQIPIFCDGRLNSLDMMASVVVYYHWTTSTLLDKNGKSYKAKVADGIELWAVNSLSQGQLAAFVSADKIKAAVSANVDTVLYSGNGIELGYSATKYFWVTGPNNYRFTWKASPQF
jgi:hypothetical protein